MKAEVRIKEGVTTIHLTPENQFDRQVIETVVDGKYEHEIIARSYTDKSYSIHAKHEITLTLSDKTNP